MMIWSCRHQNFQSSAQTLIRNVHTFEVKTQDLRLVTAGPDDQIIRRPDIVLMVLYIFIYR